MIKFVLNCRVCDLLLTKSSLKSFKFGWVNNYYCGDNIKGHYSFMALENKRGISEYCKNLLGYQKYLNNIHLNSTLEQYLQFDKFVMETRQEWQTYRIFL